LSHDLQHELEQRLASQVAQHGSHLRRASSVLSLGSTRAEHRDKSEHRYKAEQCSIPCNIKGFSSLGAAVAFFSWWTPRLVRLCSPPSAASPTRTDEQNGPHMLCIGPVYLVLCSFVSLDHRHGCRAARRLRVFSLLREWCVLIVRAVLRLL
jgi:hypothetical protein